MIYENLNNNNNYVSIYKCTDDYISCLVGCFFPYCLFGDTYEKSKFGSCIVGCSKMFSIQFILSCIFYILYLNIEYNTIYMNENIYIKDLEKCHNMKLCDNNSLLEDELKLLENPCLVNNTTNFVCDCLHKSLDNYCDFKTNKLPKLLNDLTLITVMLNIVHLLLLNIVMSIFSGSL